MSIFDTNTPHPLESLYKECKDIAAYIIPGNMMHYNDSCETMQRDIMFELKDRRLLVNRFLRVCDITDDDINKIAQVNVAKGVYIRGIPTYVVKFYYVKKIDNTYFHPEYAQIYTDPTITNFFQFTVGINGIIDGRIQQ